MPGPARAEKKHSFPVETVRAEFPLLERRIRDRPLVYLDNASTTQKPRAVLEALESYYRETNSNVHRGVHTLSQEATAAYEGARKTIRRFLEAEEGYEVVFTRGTTEAINLVVWSWAWENLEEGDEVLLTEMEHHSNIVPWQMLCRRRGARIRVLPVADDGSLRMEELESLLNDRTRIVSVVHVSNTLGTVNPVDEIVRTAHDRGIPVLVDGAQAVSHLPVDLGELGADFYVFSGHKVFGPTGIGALVARRELLEAMPPWQGGGDMIKSVGFDETVYNDVPWKFEAGTPNIAGAVGLAAALDFLDEVGLEAVASWETRLLDEATERLSRLPGVRLIGTTAEKASVLSFVMEGAHPHDIGTILDMHGIAVRTGHHCTEPLMRRFGIPATARASFALYNTPAEIDAFLEAMAEVREVFG